MNLKDYIAEEKVIITIKEKYLESSISMMDLLNTEYKSLAIEDKVNLICWSADIGTYDVDKNGRVFKI